MQLVKQTAEAALGVKAKEEKAVAVKCKPVTSVWFQPMEYTHVGNLQTRILVLESLIKFDHKLLQCIWTVSFDASSEKKKLL